MKCAIIYFSLTGNTEKVAESIQSGIKQITSHCDLLKIREANPKKIYEYDLIGIGFPIWHFIEPVNVRIFVNNLSFVGGKHVFLFSTHCTTWYYEESLVPRLKKKGILFIGAKDWYGHSHGPITFPAPYFTDGHPDEIDLQEAEDFGKGIVIRSQKISAGDVSLIPPDPKPYSLPDFVHADFADVLNWKKMTRLNMKKCLYPACRLCMDNCPLSGIDLSVDPPVFQTPCTDCHFCGQICPTGAIELNYERVENANKAINDRIKETFIPRVKEAVAKGRLRMLVKMEDLGWDTPLYKVYPGNPKWIIGKGRPDQQVSK